RGAAEALPLCFQALGQAQFLLPVQQRNGTHLAQVEAESVVGAVVVLAFAALDRGGRRLFWLLPLFDLIRLVLGLGQGRVERLLPGERRLALVAALLRLRQQGAGRGNGLFREAAPSCHLGCPSHGSVLSIVALFRRRGRLCSGVMQEVFRRTDFQSVRDGG